MCQVENLIFSSTGGGPQINTVDRTPDRPMIARTRKSAMFPYLWLELRRLVRDSSYVLVSVLLPVGMFLLFSSLGDEATNHDLVQLMVGMAGFGAVGITLNSGTGIADDRARGWLRQLRLLPLGPAKVVVARGLCAMALSLPPIVIVCVAGAFKGVDLSVAQWAGVAALLWIGIAPVALLGLGIGYLCAPQQAQAIGLALFVGMSMIGGLWIEVSDFPGWLQVVSKITPVYSYAEIPRSVGWDRAPHALDIGALAAWTIALMALALFAYRRTGRRA
ncbi:ABC transporter permease [Actinomadura montaniterrae]|uniref:ABC transporter permease n=2 Tax=Actinomadura montaniterrae TaxID=1803903 RepID=A0A6L3VU55_9ACTN|nr:ABC transporter permease [Actinomadura montaniterrae]